jgi:TPR repeat protein
LEFQQKRAAEGSASAQFDLAMRYLSGDGVEMNEATARSWLRKAAAGGNGQAAKKLKELEGK